MLKEWDAIHVLLPLYLVERTKKSHICYTISDGHFETCLKSLSPYPYFLIRLQKAITVPDVVLVTKTCPKPPTIITYPHPLCPKVGLIRDNVRYILHHRNQSFDFKYSTSNVAPKTRRFQRWLCCLSKFINSFHLKAMCLPPEFLII